MRTTVWTVIALSFSMGTSVFAQDFLHCGDLDADKPGDGGRALECISALDARVMDLESQLEDALQLAERLEDILERVERSVPALGNHPGTKAVVAYTSEKGERNCPPGWSPYEPAKDRFILGAGARYPVVGTTGGAEMVTLTEEQMPSHKHGARWRNGANDGNSATAFAAVGTGSSDPGLDSGERGGSKPHENMPPYIALYFCKKD